tara:strand:+ start:289 stop:528 length:240 start_codon:yes stop_codon:yes gene_type:complete
MSAADLPEETSAMGDVINLNAVRKQRERAAKEARAAENRARFGQSRLQRDLRDAEQSRAQRELDRKRLSFDDPDKTPKR